MAKKIFFLCIRPLSFYKKENQKSTFKRRKKREWFSTVDDAFYLVISSILLTENIELYFWLSKRFQKKKKFKKVHISSLPSKSFHQRKEVSFEIRKKKLAEV